MIIRYLSFVIKTIPIILFFVVLSSKPTFAQVKFQYPQKIAKGRAILLSTAFPGLGLYKMKDNRAYLAIGAIGYGALAGGLLLDQIALRKYDSYLAEEYDPKARTALFDEAMHAQEISKMLFIGALGVWIADYLLIAVMPENKRRVNGVKPYGYLPNSKGRYSINWYIKAQNNVPCISIYLKF